MCVCVRETEREGGGGRGGEKKNGFCFDLMYIEPALTEKRRREMMTMMMMMMVMIIIITVK